MFCDDDVQASPPIEANLDNSEQEESEKEGEPVNNINMVSVVSTSPLPQVPPKPSPMTEVITSLGAKTGGTPTLTQPLVQPSPGLGNETTASATIANNNTAVKVDAAQGKFSSGSTETVTSTTTVSGGGGPLSGAGDDGVSVVSINRTLEEDQGVVNSGSGGSGPRTYANLLKSSSTTSSVGTAPVSTQPPAAAPKTGSNGPSGSSPGSNVVRILKA